ncbi:Tetratricopeptide repeat protein [anaerobic digester metagenome]
MRGKIITSAVVIKHIIMKRIALLLLQVFVAANAFAADIGDVNDTIANKLAKFVDVDERVDFLLSLSNQYAKSNEGTSVEFAKMAVEIAQKSASASNYSKALAALAYRYYSLNNFKDAIVVLLTKVHFDDSLNYKRDVAWSYNYLGNIYYSVQDYDKADGYYQQSASVYEELNDQQGLGNIYTNLGNIAEARCDVANARFYYDKGLSLHKAVGDYIDIAVSHNNIANLLYKHLKDSLALNHFREAINTLPMANDNWATALVYNNFGDYWLWVGNLDSASIYLIRAYSISIKNKFWFYSKDVAKSLAEVYARRGSYKEAFEYKTAYNCYLDSLGESSNASKMKYLELQHLHEKLAAEKKLESLNLERTARRRLWLLIVTMAVAIISSVIYGIIFVSKQKQERLRMEKFEVESKMLQEQLESKKREIVVTTMNLLERNELVKQVIDKLRLILPNLKKNNQPVIEGVIQELRAKSHENVIKEFEVRFAQIYPEFYQKLNAAYPVLTPNDLRLCAFIRMGMTCKDIAALTHQPVNSTEVARKRLRKKFGIDSTSVELASFIAQF